MRKAQRRRIQLIFLGVFIALSACKKKNDVADAPIPATTTVSAADLKMRIAPNTTAVEIAHLSRGELVKIVQRSADPVQVGKLNAYWYKVTNSTGLTGWVYGAHLAVESDEGEVQGLNDKLEKKLRQVVIGRWEAATVQGALTPNYVTLYPGGTLDFGSNRARTQLGKYEIVFEGPIAKIVILDIKKPMMTDLKAKMIGDTLVFTANMDNEEYKLTLTDTLEKK
jgi:Bacterial SH3 domain